MTSDPKRPNESNGGPAFAPVPRFPGVVRLEQIEGGPGFEPPRRFSPLAVLIAVQALVPFVVCALYLKVLFAPGPARPGEAGTASATAATLTAEQVSPLTGSVETYTARTETTGTRAAAMRAAGAGTAERDPQRSEAAEENRTLARNPGAAGSGVTRTGRRDSHDVTDEGEYTR